MATDKAITYDNPVVQGGVDNYLGKQPQVQAPRKWQSSPDKPATELAYITEAEKDLILKTNIHGGLEGGPNMGPSGIMSLDSFGDVGGAGASGGDTSAGGGAMEGRGFSGRNTNTTSEREFDRQKANQRAALQIAERKQARDLGYKERTNIANRTYGPLQKYTGERGFFGNLFRGANRYGYTDTYTDGPNEGEVKPGYGGRILGGILGLLTGVPGVGSIIGNQIDKFKPKSKDMSEFNKLGLGGVKPGTLNFDPNAQINQTIDPAVLQGLSRFSNKSLGLQTPQTFSDPFANTVGTTTKVNAPASDAVSSVARDYSGIEDYGVDINPQGIPLAERFANFNNPFITNAAAGEMLPTTTTTEDITVDGGLLNNGSFMESQINPRVIAAENAYYNQGKMPPEFLGDRLRMNMELGNARGFMGPGFAQGGLASMFTRRR